MSAFKGFIAEPGDKFRLIGENVEGFSPSTFGTYNSLILVSYCPMLLVAGPLVESWNRKNLIGILCTGWGVCIGLHAFATNMR